MTDREKIDKFIENIKKTRTVYIIWWGAAISLLIGIIMVYGNVPNKLLPAWLRNLEAGALFSVLIPTYIMYRAKSQCPICGGNIRKYKNTFHKICPHCHTDIDPDCEFHWLEKGLDENVRRLEIKKGNDNDV